MYTTTKRQDLLPSIFWNIVPLIFLQVNIVFFLLDLQTQEPLVNVDSYEEQEKEYLDKVTPAVK